MENNITILFGVTFGQIDDIVPPQKKLTYEGAKNKNNLKIIEIPGFRFLRFPQISVSEISLLNLMIIIYTNTYIRNVTLKL